MIIESDVQVLRRPESFRDDTIVIAADHQK